MPLEQRLGAAFGDQVVGARQLDERDADMAVLDVAARDREMLAQRAGDVQLEVAPGDVGRRRHDARSGLEPVHQPCAVAGFAEPCGVDERGRLGADQDLSGDGEILELEDAGRRRPADDQLAMRPLGEEEVAGAGMDSGRHPQLDRADGALCRPHLLDRPLHVGSGAAGALGVALAGEQQQERVAAELEDVAPVPLGDADQVVEDRGDPLDELLGACLAVDGEALRERGEPRDVDRDERAVDDACSRAWWALFAETPDQARQIRLQGGAGRRCVPILPNLDTGESDRYAMVVCSVQGDEGRRST